MKINHVYLTTLLLLLLTSCMTFQPLTISNIDSVKLVEMKGKDVVIQASFKVQNPNGIGFSVKTSDLDVLLNSSFVGKAKIKDRIRIPRKSDQFYTVQVTANMAQVLMNGLMNMNSIFSGGKSKVGLKGDLLISKFIFFHKKIPVNLEKDIDLSKMQ
jgi:LEA14-like dessication related protein